MFEIRLIGVWPCWMGKTRSGKVVEFRSYPWVAGKDYFVLAQELGKPDSVDCLDLREVRPLMLAGLRQAA
jgi:hypothetical protein